MLLINSHVENETNVTISYFLGSCIDLHFGLGCKFTRAHCNHQGHPDLQPGKRPLDRVGRARRPPNVGACGSASIRHQRRGDPHHQPLRIAVLPVVAQPAVAGRVPDGVQVG